MARKSGVDSEQVESGSGFVSVKMPIARKGPITKTHVSLVAARRLAEFPIWTPILAVERHTRTQLDAFLTNDDDRRPTNGGPRLSARDNGCKPNNALIE